MRSNPDQFARENYLAVLVLITLGVRKSEIVGAKWEEFDLINGVWDLPTERSKTGVGISIPLADPVLVWLDELKVRANHSTYVLPNRRASKRFGHISPDTLNVAITKLLNQGKLGVDHFTVHDLRPTCRSLLASLKVPSHVAERCLNHKLRGVEGIYDRYDYFAERKDALAKVAESIKSIA
jgi:integrase